MEPTSWLTLSREARTEIVRLAREGRHAEPQLAWFAYRWALTTQDHRPLSWAHYLLSMLNGGTGDGDVHLSRRELKDAQLILALGAPPPEAGLPDS